MRSGIALSMLVIDVDDFKRINDELGHKKGDEALTVISDIIRRNLRKVDMPFRYGVCRVREDAPWFAYQRAGPTGRTRVEPLD